MKRKNRKIVFASKWDTPKKLSKEQLHKVRQMFYRGIAFAATAEECGLVTKSLDIVIP